MCHILRKIVAGDTGDLGDTFMLADPGEVEKLLEGLVYDPLSIPVPA
ncbi:MAG: hypothetical protein GPOALKHO_000071 [Sodalis sp.]|nr:MAG: hypothetical protein GPOALKHO_000071 [Sodalis sp.]